MILNVAVTGGDALERAAFARRFVPCVRHANSVFEVYRRKTPFAMGDVAAAAFSVNQLLCDAMMVNEAVRGLAHLYRPLQLVVHRDTPFDVADLTDGGEPYRTLLEEHETVYGAFPLDFVFKVGESLWGPFGGVVLELGPEEAADVIGKVCDASGLGGDSGYTA